MVVSSWIIFEKLLENIQVTSFACRKNRRKVFFIISLSKIAEKSSFVSFLSKINSRISTCPLPAANSIEFNRSSIIRSYEVGRLFSILRTNSEYPFSDAIINELYPSLFLERISAPFSSKKSTFRGANINSFSCTP